LPPWSSTAIRHGLPVDRGLAIDAPRADRQLQHGGVALIDTRPAEEFGATLPVR
jgi:hypothetical protein